jgi:NuA3 HAT complex component NTO1
LTCTSLDRELFEQDLETLETRVNERCYATVQPFVQDLGDAISKGIYSPPESIDEAVQRLEGSHTAPSKSNFSDIRERRKLGKRILKSVQPALEFALRVECEITNKPFESAAHDLETMINASLDTTNLDASDVKDEDTIMVDAAADTSEITVKSLPSQDEDAPGEAMDTGDDEDEGAERTIDVNTSGLGISQPAVASGLSDTSRKKARGAPASETPPEYNSVHRTSANGPPTPPQSNGSLGKQPADPLTEGGIPWHLRAMEPVGTSALVEHTPSVDESRLQSEDLTDLDEVQRKGLGGGEAYNPSAVEGGDASPSKSSAGKAQTRRASGRRR